LKFEKAAREDSRRVSPLSYSYEEKERNQMSKRASPKTKRATSRRKTANTKCDGFPAFVGIWWDDGVQCVALLQSVSALPGAGDLVDSDLKHVDVWPSIARRFAGMSEDDEYFAVRRPSHIFVGAYLRATGQLRVDRDGARAAYRFLAALAVTGVVLMALLDPAVLPSSRRPPDPRFRWRRPDERPDGSSRRSPAWPCRTRFSAARFGRD